jgi:hypothetical protein
MPMMKAVEKDGTEVHHGQPLEKQHCICYTQGHHHPVGEDVFRQGQEKRGGMLDKIVSEFRAISVQEAREMAGLSSGSLRRLLRQGRIEGQRVGRAWAVDVQSLFTYLLAAWSSQDLSGHTAHLLDYVTAHYLPRDRFDQAEALLKQLLAASEARFGREHPHTFPVLASLAKVYARPNQFAEAIVLFQRLLTLQERHLGPDHPAVVSTLHSLAKIAFEQDDYPA